jgi:serine/threonine protein kinase
MGGGQSNLHRTNSEYDKAGDCNPCFLFRSPLRSNDRIGSPMPETPVVHRRKRDEAINVLHEERRKNPAYSSKYFGIEKEVEEPKKRQENGHKAQVHEGNVSICYPLVSFLLLLCFSLLIFQKDAEKQMQAKYQLMEVLGVGSTSTCHRCVEKRTNMHYACKIIDKKLIEDRFQGMMEQFQTEIEALRSLTHPNIIQLLDVYITEGKIFIIMELMEGGELFDYVVQKGTLTEDEASAIVRKVTSALVYMHSKNIVHRDLKPENLLLRRVPKSSHQSIEVKIIDFGLSKVRVKICMNE